MNKIKVIIADESRIIREWLCDKLASDDSISIVNVFGDLSKFGNCPFVKWFRFF